MKLLYVSMAGFIFVSCASMMEGYTPRTAVRSEPRKYEPVDAKIFGFENSDVRVTYLPTIEESGPSFTFENKTDKIIKINWDQTTYIDHSGQSQRVLHSGVKIMDRNQSQPPSILPPKTKLNDDVIPTDKIEWISDAGWKYAPLCGERTLMTHKLDDSGCNGKTFSYFFTYQIGSAEKTFVVKYRYVSRLESNEKQKRETANSEK